MQFFVVENTYLCACLLRRSCNKSPDGKLCELHKPLDRDCSLKMITAQDIPGIQTYERSAVFLMLKAFYERFMEQPLPLKQLNRIVGADGAFFDGQGLGGQLPHPLLHPLRRCSSHQVITYRRLSYGRKENDKGHSRRCGIRLSSGGALPRHCGGLSAAVVKM